MKRRRAAMMSAVSPDLGRQRDLAGGGRRGAVGRVSGRLCDVVLGVLSSAAADVGRTDPARCCFRISPQGGADAAGVGCRVCRRIARRRFHPGPDGGRPGRGTADHERPIYRRRIWVAQPLRDPLRHWLVPWLLAARRLLACQEMRRRNPRRRVSPDSLRWRLGCLFS